MKTKFVWSFVSFSIGSLMMVSNAMATPIYATSVDHVLAGANFDSLHTTSENRWNPDNALGAIDGKFFSMGRGGAAVYSFGTLFDTEASFIEITYNNRANYYETANIFVWSGADGDVYSTPVGDSYWQLAGSINNSALVSTVSLAKITGNPFKFLGVVDTSQQAGGDGFDIDAISVNPVPEPATMLLFGAGLAGLAGARLRKKKK